MTVTGRDPAGSSSGGLVSWEAALAAAAWASSKEIRRKPLVSWEAALAAAAWASSKEIRRKPLVSWEAALAAAAWASLSQRQL